MSRYWGHRSRYEPFRFDAAKKPLAEKGNMNMDTRHQSAFRWQWSGLLSCLLYNCYGGRSSAVAALLIPVACSLCFAQLGPASGQSSATLLQFQINKGQEWTERDRQRWFYDQRAFPLKRIPAAARLHAVEDMREMQRQESAAPQQTAAPQFAASLPSWISIGPQPTENVYSFGECSGRVNAIAVDPVDSTGNTAYLGGAAGGVWKTTDGGATWTPLTDNQSSLAIASLAVDPNNHLNVYAGTGDPTGYYGAGVLKSSDGGVTWSLLGSTQFGGAWGAVSPEEGGGFISAVAIQPGAGSSTPVLLVAGSGANTYAGASGIWRSADGGATWNKVLPNAVGPTADTVFL